jgi:DNA-binding MarR family transcriptional regulator
MTREELMRSTLAASEALHKLWRHYLMTIIRDQRVPFSQLTALFIVGAHGPLSSRQLGETMFITAGAVTQLIDNLVAEGLVERQPHATDRRTTNLSLTPKGQQTYAAMMQKRREVFESAYGVLTNDELAHYLSAQEKITARLQVMRGDLDAPNASKSKKG